MKRFLLIGAVLLAMGGGAGEARAEPLADISGPEVTGLSWIDVATDYDTRGGGPCSGASPGVGALPSLRLDDLTCDKTGPDVIAPSIGALPSLRLERYHRYHDLWAPSSFGQGVFSNHDISLSLYRTNTATGSGTVQLFVPRNTLPGVVSLRDANNGVYVDSRYMSVQAVILLDAANHVVVDQALATTALLRTHDGQKLTFEIIRTDTSSATANRFGRLSRRADRNGNAIVIAHQYPAGASDAALGFDRTNLWKIATVTDAYGRQAAFTYSPQQKAGRWVVSRIDLPNGQNVQYSYDAPSVSGLSGAVHPDGTVTTISATPDAATQTVVMHYFDGAAEGATRKKDLYLTSWAWVDPVTHQITVQQTNLARKIVNGAGEISDVTRTAEDLSTNHLVFYSYEGGNSISRYTTDIWGGPVQLDQAIGANINQDPTAYTYQPIASYTMSGAYFKLLGERDVLGRSTAYDRDLITGALKRTTFPDGSSSTATYNPFVQPLVEVDRIGRKTQYVYDSWGNLLSKTVAMGTPDQATWKWTYDTSAPPSGDATSPSPSRGQPVTATDANGNVTTYTYTPERYLASVTEPPDAPGGPQAVTSYTYDASGRLTSMTDPRGRVTQYAYDLRNRVTSIGYGDGSVETLVHGTGPDANLLVQKTDRLGVVETYAYDAAGREAQRITALGKPEAVSRSCAYLAGTELPTGCTDRGERTAYAYDDRNRRVATTVQPSTATALTETTAYDEAQRVESVTDAYGRRTFRVYDINDRVVRVVRETVPGAVTPPASPIDPSTQTQRDAYLIGLPRVLAGNASYLVRETTYDAAGQVLSQLDGRGVATTFAHDGQGRSTREIKAAGKPEAGRTEYDYDPQGNRIRMRSPRHFTEPGGFVTQYTYTGRNLLAGTTWALGRPEQATESYGYDLDQKRSLRIDGRGNAWSTVWSLSTGHHQAEIEPAADVDGDASTPDTRATRVGNRDSLDHVTHAYVAQDASQLPNEAALRDPSSTVTEITTRHDGLYRPIARTVWMVELGPVDENNPPIAGDPGYPASMGLTMRWAYDDDLTDGAGLDAAYSGHLAGLGFGPGSDGSAVEETNPAGEKSVKVYDGIGRVVLTIDGVGDVTATARDGLVSGTPGAPGALVETSTADGLGHVTRSRADGEGRVLATIDALGAVTTTAHDAAGNPVSRRDPNGVGHDVVYDGRNREIARTDTQGDSTQSAYDAQGNLVADRDGLGHASIHVFDGRDRKLLFMDRNGSTTSYAYDGNGNMLGLTDAQGGQTTWGHDARNKVVSEVFPDNGVRTYAHDAAQRVIARTDQRGDETRYLHDRAGRMLARSYPDGLDDTFTYDSASRMLSATSSRYVNTVARAYDPAGRLVLSTLTVGGQSYPVGYAYDAANRQTSVVYPNGAAVSRTFTARNQLAGVDYAGAPVASLGYDAGGRRVSTTFGNGVAETRTYRADDTISTIQASGVTDFSYTWDAAKRKLATTDGALAGNGQTFVYDAAERLANFSRGDGHTQSWALSAVGDWSTFTEDGVAQGRTHSGAHELTQVGAITLTYDPNGNTTSVGPGRQYDWDVENRLMTAHTAAGLAAYAYDALGRRVAKTVGGVTTVMVWDAAREIVEYPAGASAASPARVYAHGSYLDEALVMVAGGQRYYYHVGDTYSVAAVTDHDGSVVERYRYDPYGRVMVLAPDGVTSRATSAVGNTIGFTGRRHDTETGLLYFRTRYHDADLGRFVNRMPWSSIGDDGFFRLQPMLAVADDDVWGPVLDAFAAGGEGSYKQGRYNLYDFMRQSPTSMVEPFSPGTRIRFAAQAVGAVAGVIAASPVATVIVIGAGIYSAGYLVWYLW
jgi:RHS repeat-associated protein